jgi:hypothetical protein
MLDWEWGARSAGWAQINCREEELGGGKELLTRARHDLHLLAVEDSEGHCRDSAGPRKFNGKMVEGKGKWKSSLETRE